MEQGSFTYKTTNYYGSQKKIHIVSWKGRGEVDGEEIREWCEKNCKGKWSYQLEGKFVFYDEKDYVLFMLRWS